MKGTIVTQNESYAIDSSLLPQNISQRIKNEEDKRKESIKTATNPNNEQYGKINEQITAKFKLPDWNPDDYDEFPRLLADKVSKDPDRLIDCLSILQGNPLGLHILPAVGKEILKEVNVRKAVLQYVDLLLSKLSGDDKVDAVLYSIFEALTEKGRFNTSGDEFVDAKKAIDLVSKNCSPKIFRYLHDILRKVENLKPEVKCGSCKHTFTMVEEACPKCNTIPPHKLCKCEPQPTTNFCGACGQPVNTLKPTPSGQGILGGIKGLIVDAKSTGENWIYGEVATAEQVDELYDKILKGFKSSLDELTQKGIVSPLLYDKSYVKDIIKRYSPEENPDNAAASSWEKFNNIRSDVLDTLISYYGNITKEIDKEYFFGGSNPISTAIKNNIIDFIKDHPESKLRMNTLKAFDEKGDLTISIVRVFLRRTLNRETMRGVRWKSERDVKIEAAKIFIGLLKNNEYRDYHSTINNDLVELVVERQNEKCLEDLELRRIVLEALVNHRELSLIYFKRIDEMDTSIEDNKKLHEYFYRFIREKLVSDHNSNKFDLAHFLLKGKYILKHLLLHTAIEPEEKERVVDIFKDLLTSENMNALQQVFYELMQEMDIESSKENKKVLTHVMDTIICSDLLFDYAKLSEIIIRKGQKQKINVIMDRVGYFIDQRQKIDSKVLVLLESIFKHSELQTFDADFCKVLVDRVYDKLKGTDQDDKLSDKIFQRLLKIDIIGKEVKEKIVRSNIEILFRKESKPVKEIVDFIKNNFIFEDYHH